MRKYRNMDRLPFERLTIINDEDEEPNPNTQQPVGNESYLQTDYDNIEDTPIFDDEVTGYSGHADDQTQVIHEDFEHETPVMLEEPQLPVRIQQQPPPVRVKEESDNTWIYALIIIVLIFLFLTLSRRK